ncbi:SGNH/GDSL hydrolase family protein [Chelativorans sp. ZYF759]|jgi:lysophospholipase L1-like esterase|uniref:SGNH/GDSL hydrolase family protein n=1 Tax=Chelativorans sp. ZYF759 TaxID=2692213 RepID=UPI00145CA6D0|nr:SGNH/GDSL hydrolase family protein [Chelativorans sp. ZYF759]NMG40715.1 SGNH/GDSL hydrolase family protein [Chelativorans sp. ZYF759]
MLVQSLISWLAFPVYVWQGVGVRLKTERMLPAEGRVLHHIPGEGEPFNLLVIGDSSAASVGVGRTEDGLAARLAGLVSERTGRPVQWRAAGFNSATAGQLRDFVVPNLAPEDWTHVVLAVGTNDMKNFHTARRFKAEFGGLLYAVRAKWPEALVLWSPVIEMTRVPALPALLARVLEIRAGIVNRVGERLCAERGAITATRLPVEDPQAGFSRDGFHASEAGYDAWARHLLPFVLDEASVTGGSAPSAS